MLRSEADKIAIDRQIIDWPISDRKGAIDTEWPEYLRVRQFPEVLSR